MLEGTVLPYGLRDVRLIPVDGNGVEGAPVDLPVSQTFSFAEAEEYEELRGDDRVVAIVGKGPTVDWNLEAGGITLEAWQVLTGGVITNSGSTPTQTKEFLKKVTDRRPYFKVLGQSVADGGGDTWCELFKCKTDGNLEGEWADGTFFISKCSGTAIGDASENLYKITWHETATPIPAGARNEVQELVIDATGGTFTLTWGAQTTSALAYDITAAALQTAFTGLSSVGAGKATVTGAAGGPYTITFIDTLGGANQAKVAVNGGSLTGGGGAAVKTIQNGG